MSMTENKKSKIVAGIIWNALAVPITIITGIPAFAWNTEPEDSELDKRCDIVFNSNGKPVPAVCTVCHLKFSEHTQPMLNACEAQNENNSSAD